MLNATFSMIFKHCDLFYFSVAQLLPSNHELLSSTAIDNCSPVLKTSFIFHRAVNCFILNFFSQMLKIFQQWRCLLIVIMNGFVIGVGWLLWFYKWSTSSEFVRFCLINHTEAFSHYFARRSNVCLKLLNTMKVGIEQIEAN